MSSSYLLSPHHPRIYFLNFFEDTFIYSFATNFWAPTMCQLHMRTLRLIDLSLLSSTFQFCRESQSCKQIRAIKHYSCYDRSLCIIHRETQKGMFNSAQGERKDFMKEVAFDVIVKICVILQAGNREYSFFREREWLTYSSSVHNGSEEGMIDVLSKL